MPTRGIVLSARAILEGEHNADFHLIFPQILHTPDENTGRNGRLCVVVWDYR